MVHDRLVVGLHLFQFRILGRARLLHQDLRLIHNLSFDNVLVEHILRRGLSYGGDVRQIIDGFGLRLRLLVLPLHAPDEIERLVDAETRR